MNRDRIEYPAYSYSEMFSEYFFLGSAEGAAVACPDHLLVFVVSGELIVHCHCGSTVVGKGEYIFLRRDADTVLERKVCGGEVFRSVFMGFNQCFLRKLHPVIDRKGIGGDSGDFADNVIPLPKKPYLESLYVSMLPYLKWNVSPMKQVLEIKLMEAVYSLILTDDRFYSCLFDFKGVTDVDEGVCGVEFGGYDGTGMQSGYMTERMDSSYVMMRNGGEVTDVYLDVTYRNVARFLNAFGEGLIFPPLN